MKDVCAGRVGVVSSPPFLVCRTLILVIHFHISSLIIDLCSLTRILTIFLLCSLKAFVVTS